MKKLGKLVSVLFALMVAFAFVGCSNGSVDSSSSSGSAELKLENFSGYYFSVSTDPVIADGALKGIRTAVFEIVSGSDVAMLLDSDRKKATKVTKTPDWDNMTNETCNFSVKKDGDVTIKATVTMHDGSIRSDTKTFSVTTSMN